jgi:ligand-binding sensor domain-containing protein
VARKDTVSPDNPETLYFSHFTKEDGLPSEVIRFVTQDFAGYIWIATDNGLVRYDGHNMKIFNHNPEDPSSLYDNMIFCIFESSDSILWIGTNNGFSVYNPSLQTFTNYNSRADKPYSFPGVSVMGFYEDMDGTVWIATSNGLMHLNKQNNTLVEMLQSRPENSPRENLQSFVYQIVKHPKDNKQIIISTQGGLLFIDKSSHSVSHDLEKNVKHRSASQSIYIDGDSVLWTGEWVTGLKKLNLNTLEWEIYTMPGNYFLSPLFIEKKSEDELWLATPAMGLVVFNKATNTFTAHKKSEANPKSLLSNYLQCNVFIDKNGNLWVGGKEGLNYLDKSYKSFQKQLLPVNIDFVRCFFREKDNDIVYFGTDSPYNVLYRNNLSGQWGYIQNQGKDVKPNARINNFYQDHSGVIWATSSRNFLLYLDPALQKLMLFRDQNNQPVSFHGPPDFLNHITEDHNHNLWISASREGIVRIDADRKNAEYFKHLHDNENSLFKSRFYTDLLVDSKNQLWIGSYDGFGVYNTHNMEYIPRYSEGLNDLGIRDQTAGGFAIDSLNRIWVCVPGKGLLRVSENSEGVSYKLFHTIHGLNDPNITKIVKDSNSNFWIINEGLLFFNPYTEQFNAFDKRNGLHTGKSHDDKIYMDAEDNIYLSSTNAYETKNISDLKLSGNIINMLINNILINGVKTIAINPGQKKPVIKLNAYENNIRFEFTAICFQDADKILYEYQLMGYDSDKIVSGFPGIANYTNLPAGKYSFVVKAAHRGVWFDNEASFDFTIKPYYYKTFWFNLGVLLILATLLWGAYKLRTRHIRIQEKIKSDFAKKIAEVEMQSLRAQMNPHFIFNSLNSINTFILKNKTEAASDYLNKFARLIRAVLSNVKQKLVTLEDELDALRIYLELEQLRFNYKFDFLISIDRFMDTNRVFVPPLLLQPYVENAVWHGLMYKETKGKIEITARKNGNNIQFIIQDNGVGRKKAAEYKSAFEPNNKSFGMSITADRIAIIKKMYGSDAKISITDLYDSNQNAAGTKVEILLPLITKTIQQNESDNY